MRSTLSLPLAVALGLGACPALADEPPAVSSAGSPRVAISYTRAKGAEKCPDGDRLRHLIIGSVGSAVEIMDGTASAAETIEVNITRKLGRFVATWKWAGADKPERVLEDDHCDRLIENVATSIVVNIKPQPVLAARKAVAATDAMAQGAAPPAPAVSAPVQPVRPGVWEGPAGIARIVAFVLAGAELATGGGFVTAANGKAAAVHGVQSMVGPDGCAVPSATCTNLDTLLRAHDAYANAAIGLLIAGGVTGAAAAVSIPLVRTPSRSVEVQPTTSGAVAGLGLRGSF